jgi:hypothetical protein
MVKRVRLMDRGIKERDAQIGETADTKGSTATATTIEQRIRRLK